MTKLEKTTNTTPTNSSADISYAGCGCSLIIISAMLLGGLCLLRSCKPDEERKPVVIKTAEAALPSAEKQNTR